MEAFLSCIVFWNLRVVEVFWKELSEILQHIKYEKEFDDRNKLLNKNFVETLKKINQENLSLITTSFIDGHNHKNWVDLLTSQDKVIVDFFRVTTEDGKGYDGRCLEELLRAFRNSSTHRYGSYLTNYDGKNWTALKHGQQKFSDGGVRFILEFFPEFSLLTYHLGYSIDNYFKKIKGRSPLQQRFYSNLSRDQINQVPKNLNDFATSFIDKIELEIQKPSENWRYFLKLKTGSKVQFFKHISPTSEASFHHPQREFMLLKFELSDKKLKNIRISRSAVSHKDEIERLINQGGSVANQEYFQEKEKENVTTLNCVNTKNDFKYSAENSPICIFSDIISVALAYILNFKEKRQFVVFSHQSATHIGHVIEEVLKNHGVTLPKENIHDLQWSELDSKYQAKLLKEEIPLHMNSKVIIRLQEISGNKNQNQHFLKVLRGSKLLEITQAHKLCLLKHNLPEVKYYVQRRLEIPGGCLEDEDQFLQNWLLQKHKKISTTKKKNQTVDRGCHQVFYITSIAGMGKTTFLANIGARLVTGSDSLVKFIKANVLVYQISQNNSTKSGLGKILESVWPNSEFDNAVVKFVLVNRRATLSLLIDGFDELPSDEGRFKVLDLIKQLFESLVTADINVVIATRNAFVNHANDLDPQKIFFFPIGEFNLKDKLECIRFIWSKYIKAHEEKASHEKFKSIISKCLESCDELGEFGNTPFACMLVARAYEKNVQGQELLDLTDDDLLNASQLYEHFIADTLLEDYVRRIQNASTPDHSRLNPQTVDMTSSPFRNYLSNVTRFNCFQAFKLRFSPLSEKILTDLENTFLTNSFHNLEHNTLIDGTLADFHAAKFILTLNIENRYPDVMDFLTLEEDQKRSELRFKYDSVVRLLDSFLEFEENRTVLFGEKRISNVHDKLKTALCHGYHYLFVSIIDNVDISMYSGASCWLTMANEIKDEAVQILHYAIMLNKVKVIKYLLETVQVNVNTKHPVTTNTALHCAILHKVEDKVLDCILKQNPDIFAITNRNNLVPIEFALETFQDAETGLQIIFGHARQQEMGFNLWQTSLTHKQHLAPELIQKCQNLRAITL